MRNYKNESDWQKEKYCRVSAFIDKDTGERLREKLKANNETLAAWIRKCAEKYLED